MPTYTPESTISNRYSMGQALLGQAGQGTPSTSPYAPLANVLQGITGGLHSNAATQAQQGNQQIRQDAISGMPFGDQGAMARYLLGQPDPELQALGLKAATDTPSDIDRRYKEAQIKRIEAEVANKGQRQMAAADKRALYTAEDEMPQIQGTIEALTRAKELNDSTFSGAGASTRAYLGSKLPDMMVPDFIADPETAQTTNEWEMLMSPAALEQMANTLKGATTDFELRKFIALLADPATPAETRKGIVDRMLRLAERQKQVKEDRINELRGSESGGGSAQEVDPSEVIDNGDGTGTLPDGRTVRWVE